MLIVENNKISVKAPNNFLWGSSVAYTHVIKTEDGLSIVENNETIKSISAGNINNNTIPHDIVPSEDIVAWYKKADIGDKLVIEYGLSNFSDRRNPLSPTEVKYFFGEDIYEYLVSHPLNTPIILYMGDYKEKSGEDYYTYLGSYPEYNDAIRAYNAKQFVVAWNNTIIPPGSISSGKDTIYFESSRDPKAPGGGASHGVCPSARALRAAILSHGFPLPTGMNWDHDAINYGFNPATGIKVTNNGDTPVKIVMWTEGEGTSMVIYSKIIEYVPN
jgi:hypothetical protein